MSRSCPPHVKPRLLGHWGTTPGLNFVYAHMNRVIRNWDLNAIYVMGPGHGGPAAVANAYLEGTYSEVYPRDRAATRRACAELFRQFSFPGGIPSHVAPETPGSIHEGGELGYALAHAYGAAFDNPDLLVCCVVGDGEAETGPLATGWHSNKFLNPVSDGAVLPILHLNGYKIANPTVLARIGDDELTSLLEGYGHTRRTGSTATSPRRCTSGWRRCSTSVVDEIAAIQRAARDEGRAGRPRWPMIVLRTPKGWTGPKMVDGLPDRGHLALASGAARRGADEPRAPRPARGVAATATGPTSCSTSRARSSPELAALPPKSDRRMSANPHANGGLLLERPRRCRTSATTRSRSAQPGTTFSEATRVLGTFLRDVIARNPDRFRLFGPDETASNRLGAVFEVTDRAWDAEIAADRRPPRARTGA